MKPPAHAGGGRRKEIPRGPSETYEPSICGSGETRTPPQSIRKQDSGEHRTSRRGSTGRGNSSRAAAGGPRTSEGDRTQGRALRAAGHVFAKRATFWSAARILLEAGAASATRGLSAFLGPEADRRVRAPDRRVASARRARRRDPFRFSTSLSDTLCPALHRDRSRSPAPPPRSGLRRIAGKA
jgi:hypothetical protein